MTPAPAPAFGTATLANCEREQIHLAGSIQPHGALLVVDEGAGTRSGGTIVQASANAAAFLDLRGPLVGRRLDALEGDLAARLAPHLAKPLDAIPLAVGCRVGREPKRFDALVHRPPTGGLVIELERAGPPVDLARDLEAALKTIADAPSLRALCDETARLVKTITGYDRVMVYRFDDAGHGEVFSERREPHLEPYLGNRYPASDIPQIARRLYERNRVRVLADIDYTPVAVEPRVARIGDNDPAAGELDMSLAILRSPSPIHVQYLRNMGVAATLVASIMVAGRLWGLVSCHHYAPRFVHYEIRAVCELLAETMGTRIAALASFQQAQAELAVRRLEQRMIEGISRDGDWRGALFDRSESLLQTLDACGAALVFEGQVMTTGEVPATRELRAIAAWLDKRPRAPLHATASLATDEPSFAAIRSIACGLLAAPLSPAAGDYLLVFRPERVRTVTWGGDPNKAMLVGDDPSQLSPRRSFAKWHEVVEGTSDPWTPADLTTARLIGESVADVVLQFRAMRMLIARDQLEQVRHDIEASDQPAILAGADGAVLLANPAFARIATAAHAQPATLEEAALAFADPAAARACLRELVRERRPWRGELALESSRGTARPVMLRADPVFASAERVLGFVVLVTDLTDERAAQAARREFQQRIVEDHRASGMRLDSRADLVYRNLLALIVDNAQLAALEIADGSEIAQTPAMLESVRASVERTAALLAHLVWHASGERGTTD